MTDLNGPPWPSVDWVAQSVAHGQVWVDVNPEVALDDAEPAAMLDFLRFLRDATTHGLQVGWRARLGRGVPIASIAHLPPPSGGTGLALNPAVSAWRERFRPDSFTWRQGPGFILLFDTRPGSPPHRSCLSQPDALGLFARLRTPLPVEGDEMEPGMAELMRARAVLRLGGLAVALPVHQTRPPIVYRRAMAHVSVRVRCPRRRLGVCD